MRVDIHAAFQLRLSHPVLGDFPEVVRHLQEVEASQLGRVLRGKALPEEGRARGGDVGQSQAQLPRDLRVGGELQDGLVSRGGDAA